MSALVQHAIALARAAADRRRGRRSPLSRREALAEAPWVPLMAASGVDQRTFRAAYADRLIERGIALPSTAELPRPSGRHTTVDARLRASREQIARWDAAAKLAGLDRSAWIRRELEAAALK